MLPPILAIRKRSSLGLPILLLLLALSGCLTTPATPVPPTPIISQVVPTPGGTPVAAAGGRIAFVRSALDSSTRELWLMRPDGSGATAFPLATQVDSAPVWSPDGTRLVYQHAEAGRDQLYVVTVRPDNTPGDTILLTALTRDNDNTLPSWSPDSKQIVFQSGSGGTFQLYIASAAGTSRPTQIAGLPPYAGNPAWSPDGRAIAFSGGATSSLGREIYTTPPGGGSPLRLTGNERSAFFPRWSPNGAELLFTILQAQSDRKDIYRIAANGQAQHALADSAEEDQGGLWSPDGRWIAYFSAREHNNEIYVIPAAGGEAVNVSNAPGGDTYPSWAPDSYHLAFSSDRSGQYRIYIVGRDGRDLQALTPAEGEYRENFPAWSP